MPAAEQLFKVVPDFLVVIREPETLRVWKSTLVCDDGTMMESVQRLIDSEGWTLEEESTEPDPEMCQGTVVSRTYQRGKLECIREGEEPNT